MVRTLFSISKRGWCGVVLRGNAVSWSCPPDAAEIHNVADANPGFVASPQHRLDALVDATGLLRHDRAEHSGIAPEAMRHLRALGYID